MNARWQKVFLKLLVILGLLAVSVVNAADKRVNVALEENGATASASSTINPGYAENGAINGDRNGVNWANGGGWNDGTENAFPDWIQIDFSGDKTIDEIDVFTLQDDYNNPTDPTSDMTFNTYGITEFDVEYWDDSKSEWITVPEGNVTDNNKVWQKFTFAPITTGKIRVMINSALAAFSRVTEIEAWTPKEKKSSAKIIPRAPIPGSQRSKRDAGKIDKRKENTPLWAPLKI